MVLGTEGLAVHHIEQVCNVTTAVKMKNNFKELMNLFILILFLQLCLGILIKEELIFPVYLYPHFRCVP